MPRPLASFNAKLSPSVSKVQIFLCVSSRAPPWGQRAWIAYLLFPPGWWFQVLLESERIFRHEAGRGVSLCLVLISGYLLPGVILCELQLTLCAKWSCVWSTVVGWGCARRGFLCKQCPLPDTVHAQQGLFPCWFNACSQCCCHFFPYCEFLEDPCVCGVCV